MIWWSEQVEGKDFWKVNFYGKSCGVLKMILIVLRFEYLSLLHWQANSSDWVAYMAITSARYIVTIIT